MPPVAGLKDVFAGAKRRREARLSGKPDADSIAADLREDIVHKLAGFYGQSRGELDATFELLPIGTRIALEQAGAVELLDDGAGDQYAVKLLPLAAELVAACHRLAGSLLLERTADTDGSGSVGVVSAPAVTENVDPSQNLGWLRLLDPADPTRPLIDGLLPVGLQLLPGDVREGSRTNVELVVRAARPSSGRGQKRSRVTALDAAASVPARIVGKGKRVTLGEAGADMTAQVWSVRTRA